MNTQPIDQRSPPHFHEGQKENPSADGAALPYITRITAWIANLRLYPGSENPQPALAPTGDDMPTEETQTPALPCTQTRSFSSQPQHFAKNLASLLRSHSELRDLYPLFFPVRPAHSSSKKTAHIEHIILKTIKDIRTHLPSCYLPPEIDTSLTQINIAQNPDLLLSLLKAANEHSLIAPFTDGKNGAPPLTGTLHDKANTIRTWLRKSVDTITALDCSKCGMFCLPEELCQLQNLSVLNLSHNRIGQIPASLRRRTSLRELYLGKNLLRELPDFWDSFRQLHKLHLNSNRIGQLPASLGTVVTLTELILETNRLKYLPDFLENLVALKILALGSNLLTHLPEFWDRFTELNELYLDYNKIEEVPVSLGTLIALKILALSHNRLSRIPDSLGDLKQLEMFCLKHNRLEDIPNSLGQLLALTHLNISFNHLSEVPDALYNHPGTIYVAGNSLACSADGNLIRDTPVSDDDEPIPWCTIT